MRMDYRMGCVVFRVRCRRLGAGLSCPSILFRLVRSPGFSRLHYSMPAKFSRLFGSRDRWFSVVRRGPQLRIPARSLHMLSLGRYRRNVPPIGRRFLLRRGTCLHPSVASVEAHPVHRDVIDGRVVNVVDIGDIHIGDGAVIEKVSVIPAAAGEAHAEIAESIVDPTIKSYGRPPEAFVEHKCVAAPTPPARSPEEADFGRHYPRARHPVVIANIVIPIPVSWSPDIAITRANWLLIHRQRRGPNCDCYSELRE